MPISKELAVAFAEYVEAKRQRFDALERLDKALRRLNEIHEKLMAHAEAE